MDNPVASKWEQEAVSLATDLARLRRELDGARESQRVWKAWADDYKDQRDDLRAEVERLRYELDQAQGRAV